MIGGTGPESTIEYYRRLIAGYRTRNADGRPPSIVINSVDNKKLVDWFTANELAPVVDYLSDEIERLARAGADFALIAANTPHLVFDEVQRRTRIPILSIVEANSRCRRGSRLAAAGALRHAVHDAGHAFSGSICATGDGDRGSE